jgi:uncharacterized surface protein with fasciclin (FAS1) repeats
MKLLLTTLLVATAAAAAGKGKDIVQIAEATPNLSTLVTAVSAAGLVKTLETPGPFTVFAPTNEAFSALPAGVVTNLLKPENKAQLTDVLTYHVVAGAAVHAKDLSDAQVIKTVEGKTLLATVNKTGVFINNAQVTTADVDASNGVVHIIDAVLLPAAPKAPTPAPAPTGKTIYDTAVATPDLSTLATAVKTGELVGAFASGGPFTVFAPTNEAFDALPAGTVASLLKPENAAKLQGILWYHVLKGVVRAKDLKDGQELTTMQGGKVKVAVTASGVFINDAQVTTADVDASNGVVHIINAVLLPAAPKAPTPAPAPTGKTIYDIAVATPDLSTLATAIKTGSLIGAFASRGPFTVFAPTNEAFDALPAGTVASLLKPENVAKLDDILKYHAVSGDVHAKDLKDGQEITTLLGKTLRATVNATGVFINGNAMVVTADVDASNGVAHVIDAVLLP